MPVAEHAHPGDGENPPPENPAPSPPERATVRFADKLTKAESIELLPELRLDADAFMQVMLNLLGNAIKFTEVGSIAISASNVKRGVQFSIEDTGVGMRQEDLPYIFDPFRQIDGSMTRKVGGSGLGLTIVKNALTILHGRIDVRSEYGRGSTFTVFLPEHFPGPHELNGGQAHHS